MTLTAPQLLTVVEVAARLRVHRDTVYRKLQQGELPFVRLGPRGAIRIDEGELELFLYGEGSDLRDLSRESL